jgi:hypothetical protein
LEGISFVVVAEPDAEAAGAFERREPGAAVVVFDFTLVGVGCDLGNGDVAVAVEASGGLE